MKRIVFLEVKNEENPFYAYCGNDAVYVCIM